MNRPPAEEELLFLTIAHDLRNPLTALNHLIYLMEQHPDEKYLAQMKTQLNHCESVVNNVLALAGLIRSEKQRVPVAQLLNDAMALVSTPSRIEIGLPETSVSVWVNREQVSQALLNVFRNAVEAIGDSVGRIEVNVAQSDAVIHIAITDTGPGFPDSVLAADLAPVISTKKEGLGIGLAAAARVIRANGGELSLANRPGRGACCSVALPAEPDLLQPQCKVPSPQA